MLFAHGLEDSVWKHSCGPSLLWAYSYSPASLGEEGEVPLAFSFGLLPTWLSSSHVQVFCFCRSLFPRLCYSPLSLGAHDALGLLLKHLICYFSRIPSSVVNLRDLCLWINMFDPFFLAPQLPLTSPVFCLSPFTNTKGHLSSALPCCQDLPVICVHPTSQSLPTTELKPCPQQGVPSLASLSFFLHVPCCF